MKASERDKELHELALEGLIARRDALEYRITSLRYVIDDMNQQPHPMNEIVKDVIGKRVARKRRKLSPEVRRKMAASQQKRWARAKKASAKTSVRPIKPVTASKPAPKPKRNRKKAQKPAATEAA